jgi:predicted RNA-binding protein with PUA-like domain
MSKQQHWLMKSEPESYSIDDLQRDGRTSWDGVRNFQARNYLRDSLKVGDLVLFYHSNAEPAGVVGIAKVARAGYADATALDAMDHHFDPRATKAGPIWTTVDLAFVEKFPATVSLDTLKNTAGLEGVLVTKRGQRLSVQPVSPEHFAIMRKLGKG